MLLILLKNGDTLKVGVHTNWASLQASAKRCVSAGYIQYTKYEDFIDEDDPWIKRMLLVAGSVVQWKAI